MRKLFTLLSLVLISGCASMNGQFDCPAAAGVSCKSMGEVDAMISRGHFAGDNASFNKTISAQIKVADTNFLGKNAPIRTNEKVMRIWLAPYVDSKDSYHASSYLYTVIDDSHWQGSPAILPEFDK